MEGDEGGIFSNALDWKPSFLLRIKIKQKLGHLNKEYNIISEHIHQNIRIYLIILIYARKQYFRHLQ